MRKLYVNGKEETNLRKNIGKKFKKRVTKQCSKRKNAKKSTKEKEIAEILNINNIEYLCEHAPEGLVNPQSLHPLYLDFYLPQFNAAIEYDGVQHYKAIHGKKQLSEYQYRDKIKNLYCRYKGIKLLRIHFSSKDIKGEICSFLASFNTQNAHSL